MKELLERAMVLGHLPEEHLDLVSDFVVRASMEGGKAAANAVDVIVPALGYETGCRFFSRMMKSSNDTIKTALFGSKKTRAWLDKHRSLLRSDQKVP